MDTVEVRFEGGSLDGRIQYVPIDSLGPASALRFPRLEGDLYSHEWIAVTEMYGIRRRQITDGQRQWVYVYEGDYA